MNEERLFRELGEIQAKLDNQKTRFDSHEKRLDNHSDRIRKNELSAAKYGTLTGLLAAIGTVLTKDFLKLP